MRVPAFFLLLALALSHGAHAQFAEKFKFWKNDTTPNKDGIFLFPLLYYTPDTRLAAGAVGVYYFNTAKDYSFNENTPPTRLSFVKLLADYTQNRQFDAWSSWNIFTNEEKFLIKGEVRYRNFPDRFYGIGNASQKESMERYSYDLFHLKGLLMRQVWPSFFAGIDFQYANEFNFKLSENGILDQGNIIGYKGGVGTGIGGVITYDTRDNVVNAYEGHLFELSSYWNSSNLGGDFNFFNLNAIFNKYWEVHSNHILALNVSARFNFGNVPFLEMATVGGDDLLRGYANNRFRDRHFIGGQIEYRFPFWKRFGMVTFIGLGDVFASPSDLSLQTVKFSFGAGLRFSVNTKERLNLRLDYGIGRNNDAFYIMLTEAF